MKDYWKVVLYNPTNINVLDNWILDFKNRNSSGPLDYSVIDDWATIRIDPCDIIKDPEIYSWLWSYIRKQGLLGFSGYYNDIIYEINISKNPEISIHYKDIVFSVDGLTFNPYIIVNDFEKYSSEFGPHTTSILLSEDPMNIPEFLRILKQKYLVEK